jgi:hypothetical protein
LYLQQSCRYQGPDFPVMLKNNRNSLDLARIPTPGMPLGSPERIWHLWNAPDGCGRLHASEIS